MTNSLRALRSLLRLEDIVRVEDIVRAELERKTVPVLRSTCKSLGIHVTTKMKKSEIIERMVNWKLGQLFR